MADFFPISLFWIFVMAKEASVCGAHISDCLSYGSGKIEECVLTLSCQEISGMIQSSMHCVNCPKTKKKKLGTCSMSDSC